MSKIKVGDRVRIRDGVHACRDGDGRHLGGLEGSVIDRATGALVRLDVAGYTLWFNTKELEVIP